MTPRPTIKHSAATLLLPTILVVMFFTTSGFTANFPMEITNIQKAGPINRIHFAYPGLEYNVVVAVRGGTYPYFYELTQAPAGMTINSSTGRILWNSPSMGGSPYICTVKVTDSEGTIMTESWTINVSASTSKFFFVDSVNGTTRAGGGMGTINNPWKNISDFYLGESDTTYAGAIIYFRTGTYTLWHAPGSPINERGVGSDRITFNSGHPNVYLAYPGETATINLEGNGSTGKHFWLYPGDNFYFQGLTFVNVWNYAMEIYNSKNVTVLDCHFNDLSSNATYANQAHLAGFDTASLSNYHVIVNNSFDKGVGTGGVSQAIESYGLYYAVIEKNIVKNMSAYGIFIKSNSDYNTIRGNIISNCRYGAGLGGYGSTSNNAFHHNYINNSGTTETTFYINTSGGRIGTTYIYRNTTTGKEAWFKLFSSSDGIVHVDNNVFVNESTNSAGYGQDFYKNKWRFLYLTSGQEQSIYETRFIFTNNLLSNAAGNVIDSNGLLNPAYSAYNGTHGWQVNASLRTPGTPAHLYISP